MKDKPSLLMIFSAVIFVNILGFILKYFELDNFVILLGFRFHLSLVIPFLFIFRSLNKSVVKSEFTDPNYKKNYPFVISLIVIPFFIFLAMYLSGYMDLGDPEYFYEFGLSSVLDLPVYLVWNSLQLLLFYFFLRQSAEGRRVQFLILFLAASLPFIYEFINIEPFIIDIKGIISLIFIAIMAGILFTKLKNIYWFVIFMFLILWQFILLFGSGSPSLIKIIFAAQYNSWEGFFVLQKIVKEYSLPVYLVVVTLLLFILSLFRKKEKIIL